MTQTTFTQTKPLTDYASFFEVMKSENFFPSKPWMTVEVLLSELTFGENWYTNGVVEFKIIRDSSGQDTFVNFRFLLHDTIEALAAAA